MDQLFEFLEEYTDFIILGTLALMSFIMLWMVIERIIFFRQVKVESYHTIHDLEIDLTRNLTTISTVGSNAPYVGLLGTVIGILLTFYAMGQSGGDIDAAAVGRAGAWKVRDKVVILPSPHGTPEEKVAIALLSTSKHPAEAKALFDLFKSEQGIQFFTDNGFLPITSQ